MKALSKLYEGSMKALRLPAMHVEAGLVLHELQTHLQWQPLVCRIQWPPRSLHSVFVLFVLVKQVNWAHKHTLTHTSCMQWPPRSLHSVFALFVLAKQVSKVGTHKHTHTYQLHAVAPETPPLFPNPSPCPPRPRPPLLLLLRPPRPLTYRRH